MPMYDYRCGSCGHSFTKMHRIANRHDPENEPCPSCGQNEVKMIITTHFELASPDQLGRVKPPGDWQNFVSQIKRNNPGSDFTTY